MFAFSSQSSSDPFHLERFLLAQDRVYRRVLSELKAGEKTSHWMWFIFPQIRGLGRSPISIEYAIASRDEARAYLQHPLLGPRLRECTQLVLQVEGRSALEVFGEPDDIKFRSSHDIVRAGLNRRRHLSAGAREVLRWCTRPPYARSPIA